MRIAIRECYEPGAEQIGEYNVKLDDERYGVAMLAFPIFCTDIVAINREQGVFYLARRNVLPKKTWWCFGGRCQRGEPWIASALRKMRQETGLVLTADRLTLIALQRYVMTHREQHPQEAGSDTPALVFIFEPTQEELADISANLEKKEYLVEGGLRGFTREQMVAEGVDPAIINLYDDVFG